MGMFDYVTCHRDLLPGNPPAFIQAEGHEFQTKELIGYLSSYEIRDNKLIGEDGEVTGTFSLRFYSSNIVGADSGYCFTDQGEDWDSVEYVAEFIEGELKSIVETERECGKALPVAEMHWESQDMPEPEIDKTEPKIGATLFLQYSGGVHGFPVRLLAKTNRKWVLTDPEEDIIVMWPDDFGRLLFHSQADSEQYDKVRALRRELKIAHYASLLAKDERLIG